MQLALRLVTRAWTAVVDPGHTFRGFVETLATVQAHFQALRAHVPHAEVVAVELAAPSCWREPWTIESPAPSPPARTPLFPQKH